MTSTTIVWRTVGSPVGRLLLASSPTGLVRVAFESESSGDRGTVLDALTTTGATVTEDPSDATLTAAATQLDEYFAGSRRDFDLPLGRPDRTFRQHVQRYLGTIPYGHTTTYREVAEAVGTPKAVRAVGTACATNPLPVIVPCHRVLRTDGGLGGYLGGPDAKKFLLALESGH